MRLRVCGVHISPSNHGKSLKWVSVLSPSTLALVGLRFDPSGGSCEQPGCDVSDHDHVHAQGTSLMPPGTR